MCTITATEFKRHFGKYIILGQKETIDVTLRGNVIFTIVPKTCDLLEKWESLAGILPNDIDLEKIDRK